MQAQRQKEVLRHHVVRILVDVAHHLQQRRRLVLKTYGGFFARDRAGAAQHGEFLRRGVARHARQQAAQLPP
jgi:hypothetical protein